MRCCAAHVAASRRYRSLCVCVCACVRVCEPCDLLWRHAYNATFVWGVDLPAHQIEFKSRVLTTCHARSSHVYVHLCVCVCVCVCMYMYTYIYIYIYIYIYECTATHRSIHMRNIHMHVHLHVHLTVNRIHTYTSFSQMHAYKNFAFSCEHYIWVCDVVEDIVTRYHTLQIMSCMHVEHYAHYITV